MSSHAFHFSVLLSQSGVVHAGGRVSRPVGRLSSIEALAFTFQVRPTQVPSIYDPQSGRSSGRRRYLPIVITRAVDRASPVLFQAALANTPFHIVRLEFDNGTPNDSRYPWRTIEVINGQIVNLRRRGTRPASDRFFRRSPALEELTLTFESLHIDGAEALARPALPTPPEKVPFSGMPIPSLCEPAYSRMHL